MITQLAVKTTTYQKFTYCVLSTKHIEIFGARRSLLKMCSEIYIYSGSVLHGSDARGDYSAIP